MFLHSSRIVCLGYRLVLIGCAIAGGSRAGILRADEKSDLSYRLQADQEFGYAVTITADRGELVDTLTGNVLYTVTRKSGGEIALSYSGGLQSKLAPKEQGRLVRRFRPPLSSLSFSGLRNRSNDLVIKPTGELVSLKGDSQLPYLLGNLSTLLIERLPERGKTSWTVKEDTGISESSGRFPRPRRIPDPDQKTTTAGEKTTYKIARREGDAVIVAKTYQLTTTGGDKNEGFEVKGSGELTYDTQKGLPASLDFEQTLTTHNDSRPVTIPLKISYRLLSDEEVAAARTEQREREAEAQQQLAQRKADLAKPLSAEERTQLVTDLQSAELNKVILALSKINQRPLTKDDAEIGALVKSLLNHENAAIKRGAVDAWAKWSTIAP